MRRTGVVTDIAGLGSGDHVCWAYRSAADYWRVLTDLFRETYLDGGFDPAATIEGYRQMVTIALTDGYAEALGDLLGAARRTGATALDISALAFADAAAARVLATAGPIRGVPPAFRSVRRILRLAEVA